MNNKEKNLLNRDYVQLQFKKTAVYFSKFLGILCVCFSCSVSAIILDEEAPETAKIPKAKIKDRKPRPAQFTETVDECIVDGKGHEYCHEVSSRVVSRVGKHRGTVTTDQDPNTVEPENNQSKDITGVKTTDSAENDSTTTHRMPSGTKGEEQLYWNTIQAEQDPNYFEAFIKRYPQSPLTELARIKLENYWHSIENSTNQTVFENYLQTTPDSLLAERMRIKLRTLQEEQSKLDLLNAMVADIKNKLESNPFAHATTNHKDWNDNSKVSFADIKVNNCTLTWTNLHVSEKMTMEMKSRVYLDKLDLKSISVVNENIGGGFEFNPPVLTLQIQSASEGVGAEWENITSNNSSYSGTHKYAGKFENGQAYTFNNGQWIINPIIQAGAFKIFGFIDKDLADQVSNDLKQAIGFCRQSMLKNP